jgi:hypothetical protein
MKLIDRAKRWWGLSESTAPIPETKAQENFRRTFLKQVAGAVVVAGGATRVGTPVSALPAVDPYWGTSTCGVSRALMSMDVSGYYPNITVTCAFPSPDYVKYPPKPLYKIGVRRG